MKRLISVASIVGVLSIASLSFAQEHITFPGNVCKPVFPAVTTGFNYWENNTIRNIGPNNILVTCPLGRAYAGLDTATVIMKGDNLSNCTVDMKRVLFNLSISAYINPNGTPVSIFAPFDAVLSVKCTLNRPIGLSPGGKIDGIAILFP